MDLILKISFCYPFASLWGVTIEFFFQVKIRLSCVRRLFGMREETPSRIPWRRYLTKGSYKLDPARNDLHLRSKFFVPSALFWARNCFSSFSSLRQVWSGQRTEQSLGFGKPSNASTTTWAHIGVRNRRLRTTSVFTFEGTQSSNEILVLFGPRIVGA